MVYGKSADKREEFMGIVTDLYVLFWQVEKEQLDRGEVPMTWDPWRSASFDPNVTLEQRARGERIHPIREYAMAATTALTFAFGDFLHACSMSAFDDRRFGNTLPEKYDAFTGAHTLTLIHRGMNLVRDNPAITHMLGGTVPALWWRGKTLHKFTIMGAQTGVEAMTRMAALHEAIPPSLESMFDSSAVAFMLSRVDGRTFAHVLRQVGCHDAGKKEPSIEPREYDILTHASPGINVADLRNAGYGTAIGCPFGRKPTKETRAYLHNLGITSPGNPLLEYMGLLRRDFSDTVLPWYEGLTSRTKQRTISPEDRRVLEGQVRLHSS